MEVTLELNGKKEGKDFLCPVRPISSSWQRWKESIGNDQNPVRTITVDFAELAVKPVRSVFRSRHLCEKAWPDFSDHIASNPKVEVGAFVVMRCNWFPGSGNHRFQPLPQNVVEQNHSRLPREPPLDCAARRTTQHTGSRRGCGVCSILSPRCCCRRNAPRFGGGDEFVRLLLPEGFSLDRVEDLILAPRKTRH